MVDGQTIDLLFIQKLKDKIISKDWILFNNWKCTDHTFHNLICFSQYEDLEIPLAIHGKNEAPCLDVEKQHNQGRPTIINVFVSLIFLLDLCICLKYVEKSLKSQCLTLTYKKQVILHEL